MSPIENVIARFKPSLGEKNRTNISITNFNQRVKNQQKEHLAAANDDTHEVANEELTPATELPPEQPNKTTRRFKEEAKSYESADID